MAEKSVLKSTIICTLTFVMICIAPFYSFAEIKIISRLEGKWPVSIYVDGNKLYTLDRSLGFNVWDISDPKDIHKIGHYDKSEDAVWQAKPDFIKYEEGYGKPRSTGASDYGGFNQFWGMGVGNFAGKKLAFIRCYHQGIQVLDVTDPGRIFNMGGRPDLRGKIEIADNMGVHITVKGEYIFRTFWDGFEVFKYSPFSAPKDMGPYEYVSEVRHEGRKARANDIKISEDEAYLYLAGDNAMDIYDISNINKPRRIFTYDKICYPYNTIINKGICVATSKGLLFLGTTKDMRIFDISALPAVKILKNNAGMDVIYPALGSMLDVKIYKNYAFIYYGPTAETGKLSETGLEIVDISNPADPQFVDAITLGNSSRTDYFRKMVLVPERDIVIIGADAFYILDVSEYT